MNLFAAKKKVFARNIGIRANFSGTLLLNCYKKFKTWLQVDFTNTLMYVYFCLLYSTVNKAWQ